MAAIDRCDVGGRPETACAAREGGDGESRIVLGQKASAFGLEVPRSFEPVARLCRAYAKRVLLPLGVGC